MPLELAAYTALADVSAAFVAPPASGLDDTGLIEAQRTLGEIRRRVDATSAVVAAEIAHRSRRELGYDGLAQRLGARTAERLVQQVTGGTSREAQSLVRIGSLMSTAAVPIAAESNPSAWLREVGLAVSAGTLTIEAADVIRAGLGAPDDEVTTESLATAASTLVREAPSITVERLAVRARDLRTELDLSRVHSRENELRDRRFLRLFPLSDGMTRLTALLDPESAALVAAAFDSATSPRRGGPRFVDPDDVARADELMNDPRTTEQIAVDSFIELVRLGGNADNDVLLGNRRPAVQVLVTDHDLHARRGCGHIEGQTEPVSIQTVERTMCDAGYVPILFDNTGEVVNVGRDERYFTARQRNGLAARDGGCRAPGCDRPPSWCEAHHVDFWSLGGKTDISRGILLCRHHHMLVHNNHWRIVDDGEGFAFIPPPTVDPKQRPVPAPSKSAAARRLVGAAQLVGAAPLVGAR